MTFVPQAFEADVWAEHRCSDPPRWETTGRAPAVIDRDGVLVIQWPDPPSSRFEIDAQVFTMIIDQINELRSQVRLLGGQP